MNLKKHFFTVRVTEHLHRLPREVVKPPSMEIFKSHLDTVVGNSWLEQECVEKMTSISPFQLTHYSVMLNYISDAKPYTL